jgi:hypothetical protein
MPSRAKHKQSDVTLEQRVRRDLDFLFVKYGATVIANTVEAFGISELIVETDGVELKFTNNKRDADYRILVAPRKVDGVWELLHVALAASTGDDANSLVVSIYYDDEPTELSYVGLTRVAEIMKPRFAQLERAFAPENYPATHSRMVEIERLVHPQ